MDASADVDGSRLTELVAAISLATDLGTGQPMEHALRTCRLSMAAPDRPDHDTARPWLQTGMHARDAP